MAHNVVEVDGVIFSMSSTSLLGDVHTTKRKSLGKLTSDEIKEFDK